MGNRRWTNPSQPQTLQTAVLLLYINAAFALLFGGLGSLFGLLVISGAVAGFGIANDQRWAYNLALVVAFAPFILRVLLFGLGDLLGPDLIELVFEVILVACLLHPQSRDYQRVWFE